MHLYWPHRIGEKGIRCKAWASRSLYMGSDAGDTHCIKLYEKGGEALIHEPGNLLNSSKVKNFRAKVLYLEFVWNAKARSLNIIELCDWLNGRGKKTSPVNKERANVKWIGTSGSFFCLTKRFFMIMMYRSKRCWKRGVHLEICQRERQNAESTFQRNKWKVALEPDVWSQSNIGNLFQLWKKAV